MCKRADGTHRSVTTEMTGGDRSGRPGAPEGFVNGPAHLRGNWENLPCPQFTGEAAAAEEGAGELGPPEGQGTQCRSPGQPEPSTRPFCINHDTLSVRGRGASLRACGTSSAQVPISKTDFQLQLRAPFLLTFGFFFSLIENLNQKRLPQS